LGGPLCTGVSGEPVGDHVRIFVFCFAILFATVAQADEAANKALVLDLYENVIAGGDVARADQLLRADYIQHNPNVPTGREGFKAYFAELHEQVDIALEVLDIRADGDMVMIHVRQIVTTSVGEIAIIAYDRFRIEDGKVAEHWDVVMGESFWDRLLLEIMG